MNLYAEIFAVCFMFYEIHGQFTHSRVLFSILWEILRQLDINFQ